MRAGFQRSLQANQHQVVAPWLEVHRFSGLERQVVQHAHAHDVTFHRHLMDFYAGRSRAVHPVQRQVLTAGQSHVGGPGFLTWRAGPDPGIVDRERFRMRTTEPQTECKYDGKQAYGGLHDGATLFMSINGRKGRPRAFPREPGSFR